MSDGEISSVLSALHDGTLIDVQRSGKHDVLLVVELLYLSESQGVPNALLSVTIRNCTEFTLVTTTNLCVQDFAQIAQLELEILSAHGPNEGVVVLCTGGQLRLRGTDVTILWREKEISSYAEFAQLLNTAAGRGGQP